MPNDSNSSTGRAVGFELAALWLLRQCGPLDSIQLGVGKV